MSARGFSLKAKTSGLAALLLAALLCSCGSVDPSPLSMTREGLLGTVVTVTVYQAESGAVFEPVFQRIEEIEEKMTIRGGGSEVLDISEQSGIAEVSVSSDTYEVIKLALDISRASEGAFDLSVGPLVKLWGIGTDEARLPSEAELEQALELVDYQRVRLNDSRQSVFLETEGMLLDLGGIAKGYAGDEAAMALRAEGLESAILDLGGDIIVMGERPGGGPWRIGIKNPLPEQAGYVGILKASDEAVVTSGGYERRFVEGGEVYHHILDPFSGFPANSGLLSVTVVCESSTIADMLSTALFVLGIERGRPLLQEYGAEAVFITENFEIKISPGLDGRFELSDEGFSLSPMGWD